MPNRIAGANWPSGQATSGQPMVRQARSAAIPKMGTAMPTNGATQRQKQNPTKQVPGGWTSSM